MTGTPNRVDPASGPTGRLADMVSSPSARSGEGTSHRETIIKIAVIAGLFAALNLWQFRVLLRLWGDPDWSHGYIIPLFSLFLIWNRRDELADAIARPFDRPTPLQEIVAVLVAALAVTLCVVLNLYMLHVFRGLWGLGSRVLSTLGGLGVLVADGWLISRYLKYFPPMRIARAGFMLALLAQVISFYLISNYWLCQLSMVAMLFFLVLYLAGPNVIRVLWLPILYLSLAMPVPGSLYSRVSLPLQNIAAKGSTGILTMFGIKVNVTASHLRIWSEIGNRWHGVTVAEACSGMRSLLAYVALGVAWAYLEDRPVWQRVVLVLSIIPVAVFCNVIRVAITCMAYWQDRPEMGRDFMHTATGMLMLIPALALFVFLGWILKRLFVEEEKPAHDDRSGQQGSLAGEGEA